MIHILPEQKNVSQCRKYNTKIASHTTYDGQLSAHAGQTQTYDA